MVKFYLNQIRLGNIIVGDVPPKWRREVEKALEQ